MRLHRLNRFGGLLPVLLAALLAAGCASAPELREQLPPPVVLRTADSTIWTTAESLAAQAAAAEAARAARQRPATPPPAPRSMPPAAAQPAVAAAAPLPPAADVLPANPNLLYFDFDRAEVKDTFQAVIDHHARALAASPGMRLVIEGHADDRGSHEYNVSLGQRRADAVVRALGQRGVADTRLDAVSFGDTRPAAEGHDEAAWAQNRRVEIKLPN